MSTAIEIGKTEWLREPLDASPVQSAATGCCPCCPRFCSLEGARPLRKSPACWMAAALHLFAGGLLLFSFVSHSRQMVSQITIAHAVPLTVASTPRNTTAARAVSRRTATPSEPATAHPVLKREILARQDEDAPAPLNISEAAALFAFTAQPELGAVHAPRVTLAVENDGAGGAANMHSSLTQTANSGAANSGMETSDSWQAQMLARLARYRHYPASAQLRHQEGTVLVRFRINRSGYILSSQIERSSGVGALDREALATMIRAQPLPAIPAQFPDEMDLLLPIRFSLME